MSDHEENKIELSITPLVKSDWELIDEETLKYTGENTFNGSISFESPIKTIDEAKEFSPESWGKLRYKNNKAFMPAKKPPPKPLTKYQRGIMEEFNIIFGNKITLKLPKGAGKGK